MKNKILTNIIVSLFVFIPMIVLSENIEIVNCDGPSDCNLAKLTDMGGDFQTLLLSIAASLAAVGFAITGVRGLMYPDNVDIKKETMNTIKHISIGLCIFLLAFTVIKTIVKELVSSDINALRFLE